MKKNYILLLSIVTILSLQLGCTDDNTPQLPTNENLLFVNSYELDITTSPHTNNFPLFDISNIEQSKVFIAVGTEPFTVMDNEVQNTDAIIWHWNTGMDAITQITFADGELDDATFAGNQSLCCDGSTYYWAAWAWDETGQYVEASTPNQSFTIVDNAAPNIIIENTVLTYEANGDGYAQKQETIRLKFFIKNDGNTTAQNIEGTFSHPLISTMPTTLNFGTLQPDETISQELEFIVPNIQNLDLQLDVNFLYNENITQDTFVVQPITLLPCVERIHLQWTNTNLIMDLDNSGADIYVTIYSDNIEVGQSIKTFDVINNDLPIFWYASPCTLYGLNENITYEFKDYDTIGADDYIGAMTVKFGDWAIQNKYPTDTTLQNNEVTLRFEINWQ
ncbi:MAG: hypothetical protein AB8G11_06115 [Saprospiraceae bacterium]